MEQINKFRLIYDPIYRELWAMGWSDEDIEKITNVAKEYNFDPVSFGRALYWTAKFDILLNGDPNSKEEPIGILNATSYPSISNDKPQNHYERMMQRRREKNGRKRT